MFTTNRRGFTLVELLVVIAIIGILASVVLVSLNGARQKARDASRVSNVRQISLALENYYDDNLAYPNATSALKPDYLPEVPVDPQNEAAYAYNAQACSPTYQGYVIRATLENTDHSALKNDTNDTTCTVPCADASGYYCLSQ